MVLCSWRSVSTWAPARCWVKIWLVTSGGQIDLSGVDMGRAAVWDGNAIPSGDAQVIDAWQRFDARSGEVVAFGHGGAAYTVRYISNNLDTPPGEFKKGPDRRDAGRCAPTSRRIRRLTAVMQPELADADKPQGYPRCRYGCSGA